MARRNAYMRDTIDAALGGPSDFNGDIGHPFKTLTVTRVPGEVLIQDHRRDGSVYSTVLRANNVNVRGSLLSDRAMRFAYPHKGDVGAGVLTSSIPTSALLEGSINRDLTGAYENMRPGSGRAGWGETFSELLRGNVPSMVPGLAARVAKVPTKQVKGFLQAGKTAGGDYLNLQFGIKPIIDDTVALLESMLLVSGLVYDTVKRERTSIIRTFTPTNMAASNFPGVILTGAGTANARVKAKFYKTSPSVSANGFMDKAQEALAAAGVDPRLLWELAPWTWLADWSTNIGTTIGNAQTYMSGKGRYGLQYAWETIREESSISGISHPYERPAGSLTRRSTGSFATVHARYLERRRGNPVRVGFQVPRITGGQAAILAALGLSRLR